MGLVSFGFYRKFEVDWVRECGKSKTFNSEGKIYLQWDSNSRPRVPNYNSGPLEPEHHHLVPGHPFSNLGGLSDGDVDELVARLVVVDLLWRAEKKFCILLRLVSPFNLILLRP